MKTLGLLALAILLIVGVVAGASLYAKSTTAKIRVEGMACEKCAARIERVLSKMDGVEKAEVNFKEKTAYVRKVPNVKGLIGETLSTRSTTIKNGWSYTSIRATDHCTSNHESLHFKSRRAF